MTTQDKARPHSIY